MRIATQRALVLTCALLDVAAVAAAAWTIAYVPAARLPVAIIAGGVLLLSWLPSAAAMLVRGKGAYRSRAIHALRLLGPHAAGLGAVAVIPLALVFLVVRLDYSSGLALGCVVALVALNAVTYVRLLLASGSADDPYE